MHLPQGFYRGKALGIFRIANLFWKGKVFRGERVTNLILGLELVEGRVLLEADGGVVIDYSRLLYDRLTPTAHGYDGTMQLGPLTVRFTLT